ncbi:MAG: hypothetical protein KA240_13345 [Nitrospira sp.]|nr:hypothetical protein [Nitrospira sp.]MBP6606665.1 hypothetical protein [Nitrospira sp.]HQY57266.1 tetratricopeptide repeat protein [Nitrospira sp.]HRA96910.1 tetratricopeptide repeat protein [Nitrospira sp.]
MSANGARSAKSQASLHSVSSEEWLGRIGRLQDALTVCPTDVGARCELATLLERLEQPEEALSHWQTLLTRDPNSLKAREGVARCRQQAGRPLQSPS